MTLLWPTAQIVLAIRLTRSDSTLPCVHCSLRSRTGLPTRARAIRKKQNYVPAQFHAPWPRASPRLAHRSPCNSRIPPPRVVTYVTLRCDCLVRQFAPRRLHISWYLLALRCEPTNCSSRVHCAAMRLLSWLIAISMRL